MKNFRLLRHTSAIPYLQNGCVVTIGNFDGLHRGHQRILHLLEEKSGQYQAPSVLLTFEPYPKEFFSKKETAPARLSSLREKCRQLKAFSLDYLICQRFNAQFASQSPADFIQKILIQELQLRALVVGEDFRFGRGRIGDYKMLAEAAEIYGFELCPLPNFQQDSRRISSTWVRELLAQGEFLEAEKLLARPYSICGRIVQGDQRGRTLGFPTANIHLHRLNLPMRGIFVVELEIISAPQSSKLNASQKFRGVASMGYRPMFYDPEGILEVHLLDFAENLYGAMVEIRFFKKLRDEEQFDSIDDLITQMHKDVEATREFWRRN